MGAGTAEGPPEDSGAPPPSPMRKGYYRLNSLDVPFASSSMSRSFELGLSRLFDCIHSLDVLVSCVGHGYEFNFVSSED